MKEPPNKISREELYERVWNTPIVRLGQELGYSYVEMVRACHLLNVPRPSGGYWYRLAHGGTSEREPLPPLPPGALNEIELGSRARFEEPASPEPEIPVQTDESMPAKVRDGAGSSEARGEAASEGTQSDADVSGAPAKPIGEDAVGGKAGEVSGRMAGSGGSARVITRQELYEKVWTNPLKALCAEFGTDYLELVRLCGVLNVPRPPRGYWTVSGARGAREQIPLPEVGVETPTEATIGTGTGKVVQRTTEDAGPKGPSAGKVVYSRRQLYEAIWSTPCQKLAESLGLSNVALAKTCRRLGIPRPSRGYWAKVAAGQPMEKRRLPAALEGQDRVLTFDVEANKARRADDDDELRSVREMEELAAELELPDAETALHPVAERHRVALGKAKVGEDGFVRLNRRDIFCCEVSQANLGKLCRALHALIGELQARGYKFKAGEGEYDSLNIVKGGDSASLRCSEIREDVEREPTEADKRRPSWTWKLREVRATGRFSFEVRACGLRGRRSWTETESRPLEEVLGIVADKVDVVFHGFESERQWKVVEEERREKEAKLRVARAAEEEARRAEDEKRQQELERLKQHAAKLKDIEARRRQALLAAARQWADSLTLAGFTEVCEALWRKTGQGKLSKPQSEWLKWAKTEFVLLNPFSKGYPDPEADGGFDGSSVPVGGPYPKCRPLEEEKTAEPKAAEVKVPAGEQAWWGLSPSWYGNSKR